MNYPLVSVIMPVYNCGSYVAAAVESILNQSYTNLELIIIDDCSTDDTRQIIGRYNDNRIVLLEKEKNTGLTLSLNLGIETAKGTFLARMDGDDVSHAERIFKQVSFLFSNPAVAICGAWYQLTPTGERVEYPVTDDAIKIGLLDYCALGHPTVMIRKDFLIENKLRYDPLSFPAEDYDLWTKIARVGQMANIPEILLFYRVHENQVSQVAHSAQLKKTMQCRVRMLCYPISDPSPVDLATAMLIVTDESIGNHVKLKEVVSWLDGVLAANKVSGFYDQNQLKTYIVQKKSQLVRRYYLNTTSYSPGVLFVFNRSNEYPIYFTRIERLKLILKCMVFWK